MIAEINSVGIKDISQYIKSRVEHVTEMLWQATSGKANMLLLEILERMKEWREGGCQNGRKFSVAKINIRPQIERATQGELKQTHSYTWTLISVKFQDKKKYVNSRERQWLSKKEQKSDFIVLGISYHGSWKASKR